ncbi:MAG: NAD(P)-dependent oxidoreductase [Butyrivibrio sp.]|uniref:NAD-dependent epimerase/dehydratase family protein n=1 Tax=Butyrivibrio sp. TaxID=28121 RepID=UPI0025F31620|nr:NAD(P)-dependent oxidoreductase [Butyrivibrio sp.]MCR5772411.1 NAD(P)-dependent oxidoreductase [Butyrivibrio sp.]
MEDNKRNVIVTGAAGFAGINLVMELLDNDYEVFAVVRPGSAHNARLEDLNNERLHIIPLEMDELERLPYEIFERFPELTDEDEGFESFFHLMWGGDRNDFEVQKINVVGAIHAVRAASMVKCRRFIGIGSQAEYGATRKIQTEDLSPVPVTSYGACKAAACYLTKNLAESLGMEWIWARIFSLIGRYEPHGRMLPDLVYRASNGMKMDLSSCRQSWNYLDVTDCARALIALSERGKEGEIYNITDGKCLTLKQYVERANAWVYEKTGKMAEIAYGDDPEPFISLQPDGSKLLRDTGWKPCRGFEDSLQEYCTK